MQRCYGEKEVKVKKYVTEQLSKYVLYHLQNKALTTGCPPESVIVLKVYPSLIIRVR